MNEIPKQVLYKVAKAYIQGKKDRSATPHPLRDFMLRVKPELCPFCNTKTTIDTTSFGATPLHEGKIRELFQEKIFCVDCGMCVKLLYRITNWHHGGGDLQLTVIRSKVYE